MFNWKYLKDEIKLQEYVDNTIIIKITNHHLSRKGRHILYSSDTAYRKPLRYTYICEKMINHDSEVVLKLAVMHDQSHILHEDFASQCK